MASIKISALGELELDRLSDADVFIVNDQDATTQKITFETLKGGLDRDARYFTGPVEFGNTVVFNGPLAGRNVYTKDETLNEIDLALQPVKDDVVALTANQDALIQLTGEPAGSTLILGGYFTTANMRTGGPYTIVSMGIQLDKGINEANTLIGANTVAINAHTDRLTALDSTQPLSKGLAVRNEERITDLEAAVGVGGSNISGNTTDISTNSDHITNLASQIGTLKTDTRIDGYLGGSNYLSSAQTVIGALDVLDTKAKVLTDKDSDLTDRVAQADIWTGENNDSIRAIYGVLAADLSTWAAANPTASAADLAVHISNEMVALAIGPLSARQ